MGTDHEWRAKITIAIVQAIVGQLTDRIVDPNETEDEATTKGKKRTRKDLYGIGAAIDTFATKSLISSIVVPFLKKHAEIIKEAGVDVDLKNIKEDPIQHQRVHSIIVGSIRAYDRLHTVELVADGKCPHCGQPQVDLHHVVWECPHWDHLRKPYYVVINAYVAKATPNDIQRQHRLAAMLKSRAFTTAVWSQSHDTSSTEGPRYPMPTCNKERRMLPGIGSARAMKVALILDKDVDERVLAFTDGTACNLDDRRRRRAAWGGVLR